MGEPAAVLAWIVIAALAALFAARACLRFAARRAMSAMGLQADLLEQVHDAVLIWELGGPIVRWNKGAEDLYGWTAAEARGRPSHELLGSQPEGRLGMTAVEAALARDGRWTGKLVQRTRGGRRLVC